MLGVAAFAVSILAKSVKKENASLSSALDFVSADILPEAYAEDPGCASVGCEGGGGGCDGCSSAAACGSGCGSGSGGCSGVGG